ncbi:hypothetical protein FXW78_19215 [Rhodococcus opacus]|nr:hypothetical protein [Rhodococcus opacus]
MSDAQRPSSRGLHGTRNSDAIVRDLRVHQILEGSNEIMRVVIAHSRASGKGWKIRPITLQLSIFRGKSRRRLSYR